MHFQFCSGITKGSTVNGELKLFLVHLASRYLFPVELDGWTLQRAAITRQNKLQQYAGRNFAVIDIAPSSAMQWYGFKLPHDTSPYQRMQWAFDRAPQLIRAVFIAVTTFAYVFSWKKLFIWQMLLLGNYFAIQYLT